MRPLKLFGTDRRERGLQLVSTKDTFSAFIRHGKTIVEICGTDGGRVASVMVLRKDLGRLEISLIVTKPEFRRRDFARVLIHKAKRIAADSEVKLVAHAENDISRNLSISEQFRLVPEDQSAEGHPMYRFSGTQIEPC